MPPLMFPPRSGAPALIAALSLLGACAARPLGRSDHAAHPPIAKPPIVLENALVRRVLEFDGEVWRTTRFARADGSDALEVRSDELSLLFLDGSEGGLDQYRADGEPVRTERDGEQRLTIHYRPRPGVTLGAQAPSAMTIEYALGRRPFLRKTIHLELRPGQSIDRLEVERFSVGRGARRGGRGEPVFVGDAWFFGAEHPAFWSRHTDGNIPAAYSGPYDRIGNHSFIDLEGHDVDRHPRPGLVRIMHFPGQAKRQPDGSWGLVGQTAIAGVGRPGDRLELAFLDYLREIRRPVRPFVHYNNWYDRDGKRLTIENFVEGTFLPFKRALAPYGVHLDAMVADDGWQDRRSVYQPNREQFPGGMDDLAALGSALRAAGTELGLWIALNGYNSDIDWGVAQGFREADRNPHFKRFKRYYSITDPRYQAALRQQLGALIARAGVQYLKHDFNEMCDRSDGTGHLPTDRHGHEASVDAELELLAFERAQNPQIYQNLTNWVWFSPWWLAHGNNLWMLASDTGEFRGWPELSLLVMAAAYRDVHLHTIWGDPATRPLVPISDLMTHGIIYTKSKYAGQGDSLRDFGDYVMMYYMRGLQLKEWYINPKLLSPAQWEVLGRATRWSQENVATLANAVLVGGDPARGQPYGYVAWRGDDGILSVRNPGPAAAELVVPFDETVWYRGAAGRDFRGRVVYPAQDDWPTTFRSGQPMRIEIPGYSVLVMHLGPGAAKGEHAAAVAPPQVTNHDGATTFTLPAEAMQRSELLLTVRAGAPEVHLNGAIVPPARTSQGRDWQMQSFDLSRWRGQPVTVSIRSARADTTVLRVEGWLLLDRPVERGPADGDPRLPAPLSHGYHRQTVRLF